ncbi:MAG: cyclic nucleotide-binding domain-containing protein [Alphaproteobacteria bacterium]|nr:cyclic nucleotide-binding domain-containing protein [Alphaproteobacteria bacterium]
MGVAADIKAEWRALFNGHFLLGRMTPEELDQLLAFARRRRYRAGEIVFRKGDPGDSLVGIVYGPIKISTLSDRGKETTFNILSPGDVFGEIALIDGRARTADATAMEDTELVIIARRDFVPFLERCTELCVRLMVVLCERIRWVTDLFEDAVLLDLPARLAKHLRRLADTHGVPTPEGGADRALPVTARPRQPARDLARKHQQAALLMAGTRLGDARPRLHHDPRPARPGVDPRPDGGGQPGLVAALRSAAAASARRWARWPWPVRHSTFE